jgi:NADPH2:quinone reductase
MERRLVLTGSTLRPQSDLAKARIADQLRRHVWPLLETGTIAPVMDSEFALEEAAKAHERIEDGGHIGKIVLRVVAALQFMCRWRLYENTGNFTKVVVRTVCSS